VPVVHIGLDTDVPEDGLELVQVVVVRMRDPDHRERAAAEVRLQLGDERYPIAARIDEDRAIVGELDECGRRLTNIVDVDPKRPPVSAHSSVFGDGLSR
jgi:hypothetical protein